ncbi:hypothetical protein C8R43DRAFT_948512 [Mycena crocata]|nr:hypothetical protein C8R43DRAFT_948512 [Mycena crocata]
MFRELIIEEWLKNAAECGPKEFKSVVENFLFKLADRRIRRLLAIERNRSRRRVTWWQETYRYGGVECCYGADLDKLTMRLACKDVAAEHGGIAKEWKTAGSNDVPLGAWRSGRMAGLPAQRCCQWKVAESWFDSGQEGRGKDYALMTLGMLMGGGADALAALAGGAPPGEMALGVQWEVNDEKERKVAGDRDVMVTSWWRYGQSELLRVSVENAGTQRGVKVDDLLVQLLNKREVTGHKSTFHRSIVGTLAQLQRSNESSITYKDVTEGKLVARFRHRKVFREVFWVVGTAGISGECQLGYLGAFVRKGKEGMWMGIGGEKPFFNHHAGAKQYTDSQINHVKVDISPLHKPYTTVGVQYGSNVGASNL